MSDAFSPFASIAPALVANGYSPIPIRPDGKMPGVLTGEGWRIMRGWSRWCGEVPPPFSIKSWSRWERANVGVALGRGVIAFDIDREEFVAPILAVLPPVVVAKKGRKGLTVFYRADTTAITSRGFKIDGFGVMDLIANGKQTVLPPSIHPDTGEPYYWTTERTLANSRPVDLPFVTQAHFDAVLDVLTAHGWQEEKKFAAIEPGAPGDIVDDGSAAAAWFRKLNEDALANLDCWIPRLGLSRLVPRGDHYRAVAEWRPSNSGKPTHKRELHVAIHPSGIVDFGDGDKGYTPLNLVMAVFDMPESQLDKAAVWLGEALGYDFTPVLLNRTPKPPGHVKPARPGGEVAIVAPSEPVGALDDDDMQTEPGEPWPAPYGAVQRPAKDWEEPSGPNVTAFPVPAAAPLRDLGADADAEFENLPIPGLVGRLVDWIVASSEEPCRTLALAASLTFVGTIAGRLYESDSGLRTNLYTLGLATSGFGKGHARDCLFTLAAKAGIDGFIGGSGIASGAGLRKRVETQASIMYMIDEFAGFMRQISDKRNVHSDQIRKFLLEYFSAAQSVFKGVDYAGEQGTPCYNPNVGFYGTSTPDDFWQSCQSIAISDGFLPRVLAFTIQAKKLPEDVEPTAKKSKPPQDLIDACREVVRPKSGGNLGGALATDGKMMFTPYTVPYGPGAKDAYLATKRHFKELVFYASPIEAPFLNRVNEHATKIGLILAIGMAPQRPVLTKECLAFGRQVAELCMRRTIEEIKGRLADNDRQREHIDVKRWIDEAGAVGISKTALFDRVNGRFDKKRVLDILSTLVDEERSVVSIIKQNPNGGPRGARFVHVRNIVAEAG